MNTKRLHVNNNGSFAYDIVIEDSFAGLARELSLCNVSKRRVCIVTESKVSTYYLEEIKEILRPICKEVTEFIFPEGEEHKNLSTIHDIYEHLIHHEFDRKDLLLALGGGVTGDMTGFAAATYLRGIDFVQVPTSLLAQVDSSIGGKTGVDFENYKNMVGAFYMPKLVYINTHTVHTLSQRQFVSGMGEVIKHGLIRDKNYYLWMKDHRDAINIRDDQVMSELIEWSCRIKKEVVEEDPKEEGIRALLNFGHTFGHSIEKLMDFKLTHGECVGIGAILASAMSCRRGLISQQEYEDIVSVFASFHFPPLPEELDTKKIVEETRHDKKMEHGSIKFILLQQVGQAQIYKDVSPEEMLTVF